MLYNRAPGAPGPLGNAPPSYGTSAVGRQGISSIGGQPSMISPVGVPTGSPLLQPGSGYSGVSTPNSTPAPFPPAQGGALGQGMGGQAPSMNPWNSSRNRSTLLRSLIGNHTTSGMQG